ncbi:hypothetical protein THASP1DRAFT_13899, partial [Thamnocephalis sphaerospora]
AQQGSPFFENEQKKDASLRKRVAELLARRSRLRKSDLARVQQMVDADWRRLEAERDLSQTIVHVDMDAFYAAVEERDDPSLRQKPMGVGVSAVCMCRPSELRYGVRSAMPGYIAKKLCPDLVIIPVNFFLYVAQRMQSIGMLLTYSTYDSAAGVDESYLNLTAYLARTGTKVVDVVQQLRREIQEKTSLTASAGIGPNKYICSDINKPNGQYILPNDYEAVIRFVRELPIRKMRGVGRVMEQILAALDVKTGQDMYEQRAVLKLLMTPKSFEFIAKSALGLGSTDLTIRQYDRKSISVERTFAAMSRGEQQLAKLRDISDKLAANLKRKQIKGSTISLKLKLTNFQVLSRAKSLPRCIFEADDIYLHGKQACYRRPHQLVTLQHGG